MNLNKASVIYSNVLWSILLTLNSHVSSGIQVSIFSATSKSMILRWTRVPEASSYKITVATQSSPTIPIAFATFGPNTVMGSVNSLSPDIEYIFEIEALDNSQAPLTSATLVSFSGDVHRVYFCSECVSNRTHICTPCFTTITINCLKEWNCLTWGYLNVLTAWNAQ